MRPLAHQNGIANRGFHVQPLRVHVYVCNAHARTYVEVCVYRVGVYVCYVCDGGVDCTSRTRV